MFVYPVSHQKKGWDFREGWKKDIYRLQIGMMMMSNFRNKGCFWRGEINEFGQILQFGFTPSSEWSSCYLEFIPLHMDDLTIWTKMYSIKSRLKTQSFHLNGSTGSLFYKIRQQTIGTQCPCSQLTEWALLLESLVWLYRLHNALAFWMVCCSGTTKPNLDVVDCCMLKF